MEVYSTLPQPVASQRWSEGDWSYCSICLDHRFMINTQSELLARGVYNCNGLQYPTTVYTRSRDRERWREKMCKREREGKRERET